MYVHTHTHKHMHTRAHAHTHTHTHTHMYIHNFSIHVNYCLLIQSVDDSSEDGANDESSGLEVENIVYTIKLILSTHEIKVALNLQWHNTTKIKDVAQLRRGLFREVPL